MHIVLENHYAHTDFNPQVSGSNDTLFHGIKCDRIEYVYMVKYLGVHWFQILLLLGIHIHVLACTVIVLYGNMVFAMILRLVTEMVVVKMRWHYIILMLN